MLAPPRRRERSRTAEAATTSPRLPIVCLLAGLGLAGSGCRPAPARPSIVLISLDCLNQRQLEQALAQGGLPSLARLAADALVFRRAYSHAPWTTPSHMSLLSGLYPSQHGRDIPFGPMTRFNRGYDRTPLFRTLPERLAEAGYETVAFVGRGSISAEFGLAQGFSAYHESGRDNPAHSDLPATQAGVREWLQGRAPGPFLLFYHTYDLHYPLPVDRRPWQVTLRHIDGFLAELLSLLDERGLYDSSILVLTGDHGSEMIHSEQKCCVHGAGHYEENLRVPLLLKLAQADRHGWRDELVRHVDLLPTLLDAAGVPLEGYMGPGLSILRRLGARGAPALVSYSEADGRCVSRRAVVNERYKYIYTPDDPWHRMLRRSALFDDELCRDRPACKQVPREELYDLAADRFEERNLIGGALDPEARDALRELRAQLTLHLNLSRAYRTGLRLDDLQAGRDAPAVQESLQDALRALGYVK